MKQAIKTISLIVMFVGAILVNTELLVGPELIFVMFLTGASMAVCLTDILDTAFGKPDKES